MQQIGEEIPGIGKIEETLQRPISSSTIQVAYSG
jgi:hypothetical protein